MSLDAFRDSSAAIGVLEFAREHGKRHVAIVDDRTGEMIAEEMAHQYVSAWG